MRSFSRAPGAANVGRVVSQTKTFDDIVAEVEVVLGHRFAEPSYLKTALTHRSYANERPDLAPKDNERLEFLGDSLVGFVVAKMLVERFPDATEGELTRRRAELVREAGLAAIARDLGLGDALRLGKGEQRHGGREKPRLLASAFEACCGAILMDSSEGEASRCIRPFFEDRLETAAGDRDFKSKVQELVQSRRLETPRYVVVDAHGPDHDRVFEVAIEIDGAVFATGTGRSKVEAEQSAASAAFSRLTEEPAGESA